nr:phosphoenolpyruvate carboxykinase (ATP) [Ardenticatena sp.]
MATLEKQREGIASMYGLEEHGLEHAPAIYWNLPPARLYEEALKRGEGVLAAPGTFTAVTAPHTGRSPKDRFVVREPSTENDIWWGNVNVPIAPHAFDTLYADITAYLRERDLFVRDMYAGADPEYRINVRLISESAWHNLFAYNMFVRPTIHELPNITPDWTILHAPHFKADPSRHGTRTETAIVLNFARKTVLIAGTKYAGEIKKSIFAVMNFWLPSVGVLPMHCSANLGENGDTALFFGLSGTGKTTLSSDPTRYLIGDDEHGWSPKGIFNFEGGCYAKVIRLSLTGEPEIYAATLQYGSIMENVILDPITREPLFEDDSITENTRSSYPLTAVPKHVPGGQGHHPEHIFFLSADAFGVLPPISRLTPEQAMYYFISGYTAKVAGTERGITEPQATFSECFGAPFLPRTPTLYAKMLGELMTKHNAKVWLVNTGWTGGPYGVGRRMKLDYTRAMVRAALNNRLNDVETVEDPIFGLHIPVSVPDVPDDVLVPRNTWADKDAYDAKARELAQLFRDNFEKYEDQVDEAVLAAGPKLA